MDLQSIEKALEGCPCGRKHTCDTEDVIVGHGTVNSVGAILRAHGFPKTQSAVKDTPNLLIVADKNTLFASEGILPSLSDAGYTYTLRVYDNLREAQMDEVNSLTAALKSSGGVLSVGTGSLNDICRLASFRAEKDFAIFATAPSMDGFASGTAPIVTNGFKETHEAHQPRLILADTAILAKSPQMLKGAGFGDMIGKLTGLCDWKISHLLTGEYYCPAIAGLTKSAVDKISELADGVQLCDETAAAAVFEALIMTGIAMKFADSVRPASGAEHIVSHFWDICKMRDNIPPDFHGRDVGVATVLINRLYRKAASYESIKACDDKPDWDKIYAVYGERLKPDIIRLNAPSCLEHVTPERLEKHWDGIRSIVFETLPDDGALVSLMKRAGTPTEIAEVNVSPALAAQSLKYHPYMRRRLTLARLLPMTDIAINPSEIIC